MKSNTCRKVLMIGGTGQLGHFVAKHLASAGIHVVAVGVGSPPEPGFLPAESTVVMRDTNTCSAPELAAMLTDVDAVIHAAGADGRNLFGPPAIESFRAANVAPVIRLVEAMKLTGCRKLIILGSYYTAMARLYPGLDLSTKSPYIASRMEQNAAAFAAAGDHVSVAVLELPYIFGAAPGRGTLWGFYIDKLLHGDGELAVHSGGTACVTMNQVGIATANLCRQLEGHRNFPLGNVNLKYAEIFRIFAGHLGVNRPVVPRPADYFAASASEQTAALRRAGREASYDPAGLTEMEALDFYIDPLPPMQALGYSPECLSEAIRESIEATKRHAGEGPGSR